MGNKVFSPSPEEWRLASWSSTLDDAGRFDVPWLEKDAGLLAFVEIAERFVCFYHGAPSRDVDLGDKVVFDKAFIEGRVAVPGRTPATGAWVFARLVRPPEDAEPNLAEAVATSRVVIAGRNYAATCACLARATLRSPAELPRMMLTSEISFCLPTAGIGLKFRGAATMSGLMP